MGLTKRALFPELYAEFDQAILEIQKLDNQEASGEKEDEIKKLKV